MDTKRNNNVQNTQIINYGDVLHALCKSKMSIQQWRFFTLYLARIDINSQDKCNIKFSVNEFAKIMEITTFETSEGFDETTSSNIKKSFKSLLMVTVYDRLFDGSEDNISLFKGIYPNDISHNKDAVIEIGLHSKILEFLKRVDFQLWFFKFELWKTAKLRNKYHLNLFIYLQNSYNYYSGDWKENIEKLYSILDIDEQSSYRNRWDNFKNRVLEPALESIYINSGERYGYQIASRNGKGGEISSILLYKLSGDDYSDPLKLDEFTDKRIKERMLELTNEWNWKYDSERMEAYRKALEEIDFIDAAENHCKEIERKVKIEFFTDACNNEFTYEQIEEFVHIMTEYYAKDVTDSNYISEYYNHLKLCYERLNNERQKMNVDNPFKYMRVLLFDKK